jgi:alcohol dehydrogenase class IV
MRFEFATATRIVFGPGTAAQAGTLARDFGRHALVTTGRDAARAGKIIDTLKAAGIRATLLPVPGEPDLDIVRNGAATARREQCDMVIGFGGGSALDAGKAIAAMMTNGGDVLDYLEVIGGGKPLAASPAPFIAIPTTAGTGSEVTRNAVLASPEHRVKVSMRSPLMLAKIALVDPELTWNLPPSITAATGLDALTQVIEPYVSSRANPMTDGLCLEGMTRAARSLRIAVENGGNAAAREDMAIASLFGGLALANAGLGAVHGFAGVIGGMFPAPHGAICAALLPHVMAANISALRNKEPANRSLARYATVAQLLTGKANASADDGVEWVRKLVKDLQIPKLARYGIESRDFGTIVDKSTHASSMKANPLVLSKEELLTALTAAA